MLSIPEIAAQIVNKNLSEVNEDSSRTIFIVGSKSVGKSTLINSFLDKPDAPRETLVLEYSFGRKSNQKQGIEKTICHVWEYGGKLDVLKSVLASVPVRGKFYFFIMVDLSKVKTVWATLEYCINAVNETYDSEKPETVIICGKYDLFKNYDSEIKKFLCTTLRSVAIVLNSHLIFYSSKEPLLARRAKDMLTSLGLGNGVPFKDKNTSFTKPLLIPKGTDTWESIGVAPANLEQIKLKHNARIPPEPAMDVSGALSTTEPLRTHPESTLDAFAALKYDELSNIQSLDISIDEYLKNIRFA